MTSGSFQVVGSVATLWRYPVKSMRGERPDSVAVDRRGLIGDRLWAVWDAEGKFGSCKDSRRFRRMDGLLDFVTAYPDDPTDRQACVPRLLAPDGARYEVPSPAADAAVRRHLGRQDVRLMTEAGTPHHDAAALHLVSTATLEWHRQALQDVPSDERRLRPNLVVHLPGAGPFAEDGWAGRRLRIGSGPQAVLARWVKPTERCRTLNVAQDDLPYTARGLKSLAGRGLNLGVYLEVLEGGRMRLGDPISVEADHG